MKFSLLRLLVLSLVAFGCSRTSQSSSSTFAAASSDDRVFTTSSEGSCVGAMRMSSISTPTGQALSLERGIATFDRLICSIGVLPESLVFETLEKKDDEKWPFYGKTVSSSGSEVELWIGSSATTIYVTTKQRDGTKSSQQYWLPPSGVEGSSFGASTGKSTVRQAIAVYAPIANAHREICDSDGSLGLPWGDTSDGKWKALIYGPTSYVVGERRHHYFFYCDDPDNYVKVEWIAGTSTPSAVLPE